MCLKWVTGFVREKAVVKEMEGIVLWLFRTAMTRYKIVNCSTFTSTVSARYIVAISLNLLYLSVYLHMSILSLNLAV